MLFFNVLDHFSSLSIIPPGALIVTGFTLALTFHISDFFIYIYTFCYCVCIFPGYSVIFIVTSSLILFLK